MKVYQRFSNSSKFVNREDFSGLASTQTPNKDTSFRACYVFANIFTIRVNYYGRFVTKTFLIRHKYPGNLGL